MSNSIARRSLKFYSSKKIVHRIQLLIYRENAQQVAFTPVKFDKQSYWSKARHCTFIYRVARSKKEFVIIHQMIINQVAPFLNNVSFFESFCSLKVGCFTATKNASRVFFFAIIHRWWHEKFPLKNMIRVFKDMLGWFWIFVSIFMVISTINNISFCFTYVIFLRKTDPLIDFTWRV